MIGVLDIPTQLVIYKRERFDYKRVNRKWHSINGRQIGRGHYYYYQIDKKQIIEINMREHFIIVLW